MSLLSQKMPFKRKPRSQTDALLCPPPPAAGSYVALTVLGRPPGLAQIPLSEAETEMLGVSISSPNSPAAERPYSPQDRFSSPHPSWVRKIRRTSCVQSVLLSHLLTAVIRISSCSHISSCFFVSNTCNISCTHPTCRLHVQFL